MTAMLKERTGWRTKTAGILVLAMLAAVALTPQRAESRSLAPTPEDVVEVYGESYSYEQEMEYENAIEALRGIYDDYPAEYTVNLRLGWLHYLSASYKDSSYHYQKAMNAAPASIEAKVGLLLPLIAQGKYEDAETIAYQVLRVDKYNYYANVRLTYTLRMQKKFALAENIAADMLELYPSDITFLTELALIEAGDGEYEVAGDIFRDILVLDPGNAVANNYFAE